MNGIPSVASSDPAGKRAGRFVLRAKMSRARIYIAVYIYVRECMGVCTRMTASDDAPGRATEREKGRWKVSIRLL